MSGWLADLITGKSERDRQEQELRIKRQQQDLDRMSVEQNAYRGLADLIDKYNAPEQPAVPAQAGTGIAPRSPSVASGTLGVGLRLAPPSPDTQPGEDLSGSQESPEDSTAATPATLARIGVRQVMQTPTPDVSPLDARVNDLADKFTKEQDLTAQDAPRVKHLIGTTVDNHRIGVGLFKNPSLLRNPQFIEEASKAFLKAGMPEGVAWLQRGSQAAQENGVEALQLLVAGDPRGAESAFNAGGNDRMVPGSTREVGGGKWETTMATGEKEVIDPRQALRGLLNPRDFFNLQLKERAQTEAERRNLANEDIKGLLAEIREQHGVGAETALVKNIRYLVDNGIAENEADAFGKLRTASEKSEPDAILSVVGTLLRAPGYMGAKGKERALADATSMVRALKGSRSGPSGPSAAAGSVAPGAAGRTYSVGGRTFTDADIASTARIHNITPEQVKAQLGVR